MAKPRDERQKDLLRPALDQIIDMGHPLVRLAGEIDWEFLDKRFAAVCTAGAGQPPLPTRLVAGLFILKHMHDLSDEVLCARWLENPYYQFFCGELSVPPRAAVRSLLDDALAPAAGRGAPGGASTGEPVGGAQDRGAGDQGSRAGGGGHDGAAEGDRPSDRCAADAPGIEKLVALAKRDRRAAAAELSPGGQARRDHGRALHPRAPVQARPARNSSSCAPGSAA